ncbi:MAG TPA: transaldolase family protein [Spirochaetia bacterium]|nr:transaldolase family protein [Spirochaetia bacterium]
MSSVSTRVADTIKDLVMSGIDTKQSPKPAPKDTFWQALRKAGTELWLDTGDIDEARKVWTAEMTALTTNNTLLNREIQKGIYDDFIKQANKILPEMPRKERVMEIAFILNARHGLRLVQEFGGRVSVELHTDLADDLEGIVSYGKRFHAISPDHFIVKVPLTATGLLGARKLRELGIPINFTLEFSARQNALATIIAKPNYLNVFLGRLNAYVADNGLGSGDLVGEKATLASQRAVRTASKGNPEPTRQIAASMRGAEQVELLAGVDVYTMPTKVAHQAHETLKPVFSDQTAKDYEVTLKDSVDPTAVRIEDLWTVGNDVLNFAREIDRNPPSTGVQLAELAHRAGIGELFPRLSAEELATIAKDGKIPVHATWKDRVQRHEVAVDSLLNLAGLASFTADQADLDHRIESLI